MAEELVRFGEFELDRAAYQLRRKGRAVRLERIPLDLLLFLIERRGELVTRDEIRKRIWGENVFVDTESSINTAIRKLRRALRDRPRSPRFIETVAAKGYRFITAADDPTSQTTPVRQIENTFTDPSARSLQLTARQNGERRHLTVLVCELMISPNLTVESQAEELWETVSDYHRATVHAIEHYGGHVGSYRGDAMMVYFGWPEAHDNDAERAAFASLAIIEAVAKLNEESAGPKISARIGIDSGMVVVTRNGENFDVFGDSPNIAARVKGTALPGTVMVTAATERLISGLFVVEDCESQVLHGIEPPIQLYRIVQSSGVRGRLAAVAVARGLTPFVGREDDLRLLINHWQRTLEGEGQAALIIGEPGIGKSRLVQHFHLQLAGTLHSWAEVAAVPFFQNTPFYSVSELLRQILAVSAGKSPEDQLVELESVLESLQQKPVEAIPLIAPLLNLPVPEKYPPLGFSGDRQRRRLLATLVELVHATARVQPLIIAVEDLHWADPSTLELLQLLVEQMATAQLLLLYTARPEFRARWTLRPRHIQVTLTTLAARDVRAMIEQLTRRHKTLPKETVATVVDRSGGVPLFVEELTRALLESTGDSTNSQIPATLDDSLIARLDRLGTAKQVAQIAAVIGREFSYELINALHLVTEEELQSALGKLAEADLVYVRGIPPEALYTFRHTLIRDAAYKTLLKSNRKELHRQVACTIEETFPALKETHPEVLARHWTEAGETERAITEWERAGKTAEARFAFIEAQESLQNALSALNLLPESPERDRRELEIRQALVSMLLVTRGWNAPETIGAATQVRILGEKSGEFSQLLKSEVGRIFHAYIAGELSAAATLADETFELVRGAGNPTALAWLYYMQLLVRRDRGEFVAAENYFAAGLRFFEDPIFRRAPTNPVTTVFGWASCNAWTLGRADLARVRMAKVKGAVRPANPYDLVWSNRLQAALYLLTREYEAAEALAFRALDLCEKHGFPNDAAMSRVSLGHARAQLGHSDGLALIRQGIDDLLQIGCRIGVPQCMTDLAAAQLRGGAVSDAFEMLEQALNFNPENAKCRPETLRIRGEVRLKQWELQLAEADFRDSISMARSMGAKAWELRSTMSFARLLNSDGRRAEARMMLAEIYNWFTEGFDTPDLIDAKALLDELSD